MPLLRSAIPTSIIQGQHHPGSALFSSLLLTEGMGGDARHCHFLTVIHAAENFGDATPKQPCALIHAAGNSTSWRTRILMGIVPI
jgi:hypothetical protein